jgi:hypothetical protein
VVRSVHPAAGHGSGRCAAAISSSLPSKLHGSQGGTTNTCLSCVMIFFFPIDDDDVFLSGFD